jgi:hypothetical protein
MPHSDPGGIGRGTPPLGGKSGSTGGLAMPEAQDALYVFLSRVPETAKGLLGTPFCFQTAPIEEFKVSHAYEHADFMTVRFGQYSRPSGRQLRQVPYAGLILNWKPPWSNLDPGDTTGWWPNIEAMVDELKAILNSGTPFHIFAYHAITGIEDLDMDATMRTLDVTDRAGEPDTRYLDITFTEYRRLGVQDIDNPVSGSTGGVSVQRGYTIGTSVPLVPPGGNKGGGVTGKTPARVSPGQLAPGSRSLYDLAKQYYGSTAQWTRIANANPGLGGFGPSSDLSGLLPPDQSLLIPKP